MRPGQPAPQHGRPTTRRGAPPAQHIAQLRMQSHKISCHTEREHASSQARRDTPWAPGPTSNEPRNTSLRKGAALFLESSISANSAAGNNVAMQVDISDGPAEPTLDINVLCEGLENSTLLASDADFVETYEIGDDVRVDGARGV